MRMIDLIVKKRDGYPLGKSEYKYLIQTYTNDHTPDYQVSAFLMAAFLNGLSREETANLTYQMAYSGETLDLTSIPGKVVDKHSTGGVGDKTTLVLAPLVASTGVKIAKMSGRGLGHTGGTIDKLESFPGFNVNLSIEKFIQKVKLENIAMIGQTKNLAPADGKLYALRDVTATVDSKPFIASSIMSKKIASGADAIVLDVKVGSGAFMQALNDAIQLAHQMVKIGNDLGRETVAIISNMDQPLGYSVGNILEVKEAINTLQDDGPEDLKALSLQLGANMLLLAERVTTSEEGKALLQKQLHSGKALDQLKSWIETQGGQSERIVDPSLFPIAEHQVQIKAQNSGYIAQTDAKMIGEACVYLGAGREKKSDEIDRTVGIDLNKKIGDKVSKGETLAVLHYNKKSQIKQAENLMTQAFQIKKRETTAPKLIYGIITKHTGTGEMDELD